MASVSLIRLNLALIFLTSVTTATVLYQEESVCGGMDATVVCTTTTFNGFLQWSINNGPPVFTLPSTASVNASITIDGSVFVLSVRRSVSGANVYISTASLNTSHVTSVQCFDGTDRPSESIQIQVRVTPIITPVRDNESIVVSLTSPASAGVCCERYHVTTPDGTIPSTSMTSYTLNITTPQQRQDAFISVRCLDRLGTMGPVAFYRPNITTTDPPSSSRSPSTIQLVQDDPPEDFCSRNVIMLRYNITIIEPGVGNPSCSITNIRPDSVKQVSCSIEDGVAYFRSDAGLVFFTADILYDGNIYPIQFDPRVYLETCQIPMWTTLFGVFCALFILLLVFIVVVVVVVVAGFVVCKVKKRPLNVSNEAMHYHNEEKDVEKAKA